ncbi:hypothetical protein SDJN03_14596, partial [Cucurbita argyrosperma subsp. sororia]
MKRTKQTLVDDEERFSISRFLGFHVNTISSPFEDTHLDGSHPPPTEVDPPVDKSGQEESAIDGCKHAPILE